jgi:hypothetical protein
MASPICGVPLVRRLTPTSINLRIDVATGGFVDVFYNEQTDTLAYALIRNGQRVFGVDNTGGWHRHPFDDPRRHDPLSGASPVNGQTTRRQFTCIQGLEAEIEDSGQKRADPL